MLSAAKPVYPLPQRTIRTHTLVDRTTTPAATILTVAYDKNLKKTGRTVAAALISLRMPLLLTSRSPLADHRRPSRRYRKTSDTRCIIIIVFLGNDNGENIRDEHPEWYTRVQNEETRSPDAFWLRKRVQLTSQQLPGFLVLNSWHNNISFTNIIFYNNKKYGVRKWEPLFCVLAPSSCQVIR